MSKTLSRTDRAAVAVFDVFFFLLLLFLAAAVLAFLRPHISAPTAELTYSVCFSRIRTEYIADIHEGDAVLDAVGKRSIGQVIAYTAEPDYGNSYDRKSNRLCRAPYPGYVSLTLYVRASGTPQPTGEISLSGLALMRGRKLPLRLPNFVGTGVVTDYTLLNFDS